MKSDKLLDMTTLEFFSEKRLIEAGVSVKVATRVRSVLCHVDRDGSVAPKMQEFLSKYGSVHDLICQLGGQPNFGRKSWQAIVQTIRLAGLPYPDK